MENQITLNEWMEWKEDIRKKLQETADNFVYIGYRLKQIRDSGMLDGCSDIFEFAQKEYGLGKSTVSRFIAINEKFSEGGNSLELRSEYRAIGSSKLAEMLTLPDAECQLITEKTTVKEIRELKSFDRQQASEEEDVAEITYTPLQKCIIDFLSDEKRKDALNQTIDLLAEDPCEMNQRKAAELLNPGEYATHKKGIVFLFLYDYNTGIKYKKMGEIEPVSMTWTEFLAEIIKIYQPYTGAEEGIWNSFYHVEKEEEKAPQPQSNQGESAPVATSQQTEKEPAAAAMETTLENVTKETENVPEEAETVPENIPIETTSLTDNVTGNVTKPTAEETQQNQGFEGSVATSQQEEKNEENKPEDVDEQNDQIVTQPIESLRRNADYVAQKIACYFDDCMSAADMQLEKLVEVKTQAEELVAILEQIIEIKQEEEK